jgi:uncharacterized membrane protein YoaK (UPF0700 family)
VAGGTQGDQADGEQAAGRPPWPARAASRAAALRPGRLWLPVWGPLPELLLALTMATGIVDAISILALGRVFVANMTGNVVFAGFAIVGAPWFSLSASAFALAGFLAGAFLGGMLATRLGSDRAVHLRAATLTELALFAAALIIAAASGGPAAWHGTLHLAGHGSEEASFGGLTSSVLALLLAVAMGFQNSAARKLAVPDLTTTVLTQTLTGIGADPRSDRRDMRLLARRVLAVVTMMAGAIAGAWLVMSAGAVAALIVATVVVALVAAGAAQSARHPADWRPAAPPADRASAKPLSRPAGNSAFLDSAESRR